MAQNVAPLRLIHQHAQVSVIQGKDETAIIFGRITARRQHLLLVFHRPIDQQADLAPRRRESPGDLVILRVRQGTLVVLRLDNDICGCVVACEPQEESILCRVGVRDIDPLSSIVDLLLWERSDQRRIKRGVQESLNRGGRSAGGHLRAGAGPVALLERRDPGLGAGRHRRRRVRRSRLGLPPDCERGDHRLSGGDPGRARRLVTSRCRSPAAARRLDEATAVLHRQYA